MRVLQRTVVIVLGALAIGVAGAAALRARQAQEPLADGTLAGLTAEVRSLRLSIEDAAKTQSRVQSYGVYLTVQKDRILQATQRLDSLRRSLEDFRAETQQLSDQAAEFEAAMKKTDLSPADRTAYEQRLGIVKSVLTRRAQDESAKAVLVQDAEAQLTSENGRWNELVSQLEQLIRR